MRKIYLTIALLLVLAVITACQPLQPTDGENAGAEGFAGQILTLATTTSTDNSGLLAAVLPDFEEKTGAAVEVIAVGTGQALKLGEDGNADVLLVHARAQRGRVHGCRPRRAP